MGWLGATVETGGIGVGLLLTTFGLGLRHGVDWDHLAAIADLSSGQTSPRRSMLLSTLYAVGHALVVLVLGVAAIVFAEQLPSGIDVVMERVVGATLVLLSLYVAYGILRHRGSFRMRSRWMLVADGLNRLRRRLTRRRDGEVVVIVHEHEHAADAAHHPADHHHAVPVGAAAGASAPRASPHVHLHSHVGVMPPDPSRSEAGAAFGIGMLHGVGAETPTQVLVFLGAHAIGGGAAGVTLLVCFLAGLFTSNTLIAVAAAFGFLGADRNRRAYVTVSVVVALLSLGLGLVYLTGRGADVPAFFG